MHSLLAPHLRRHLPALAVLANPLVDLLQVVHIALRVKLHEVHETEPDVETSGLLLQSLVEQQVQEREHFAVDLDLHCAGRLVFQQLRIQVGVSLQELRHQTPRLHHVLKQALQNRRFLRALKRSLQEKENPDRVQEQLVREFHLVELIERVVNVESNQIQKGLVVEE